MFNTISKSALAATGNTQNKIIKNENKTKGNDEELREGDWVTWEMGSVD